LPTELPDYRIIEQLGLGAGSSISLAVYIKTGKKYAVKNVERKSPDDDVFVKQAENEYEISQKIDSDFVRKSYSIHRIRKLMHLKELILVMELVQGLSLEKARPNRLKTFLTVFTRVAQGLQAMHEAGFVHSDIKPTNIMVSAGGVVKIIDLGQSCPLNFRKGRIQGTPDFIAPEQVQRLPLDQRTDVFNFGATMYWVLTSENYPTKIQGTDDRGGINIIRSHKPIAPIEINDKIPLALSQLVMECCRERPADRPVDMKQLISRLSVIQQIWNKHRETKRMEMKSGGLAAGEDVGSEGNDDEPMSIPEDKA